MSEILTRITLPGQRVFSGLMDWGTKSTEEMIKEARKYSAYLRAQSDEIDRALYKEFQIDVIRGSVAERHVREVQRSSRKEIK